MPALRDQLCARALDAGFDQIAITAARLPDAAGARLVEFVEQGWHGDMAYLADTLARRKSPEAMWPQARSAIVLAVNYGPDCDPLQRLKNRAAGVISVYALNRDYHDLIKGRLKTLAQWLAVRSGADVKVFVDTAPLMEKPLAAQAGLGWQGKHTNVVSRRYGSWLFLGVILSAAELQADTPGTDHCGACTACLDICPTRAFAGPYRLDATKCISYLTIEHKGHIDRALRAPMGNRIFGCDDCLAVCPWNKFAAEGRELKLEPREELRAPSLVMLAGLDDRAFRQLFSGSPVKRIGRDRFVRNVMIALGNSAGSEVGAIAAVLSNLHDHSALVRAMSVWALARLASPERFAAQRTRHLPNERDDDVAAEWRAAGARED